MLRIPLDLYEPPAYRDASQAPSTWARSVSQTVTGATVYAITAFSATRGSQVFLDVPPDQVAVVTEARATFLRTTGTGIVDGVGWAHYVGSTLAGFFAFANDLTALTASSWRTAGENPAVADVFVIRDVLLMPGETLAWYLQTASDTSSWLLQIYARGWLLPRGNLARL